MSLDLNQVAAQIDGMAADLKADEQGRKDCLRRALDELLSRSSDIEALRAKLERSKGKTTWLVAGILNGLGGAYEPAPLPPDFVALATDGSHIDVDRHSPARCYLINIGSVLLRYGRDPDASLRSQPSLYANKRDLSIADPSSNNEQRVEGALLGIKRMVAECLALAELADELPPDVPAIALLDGSLILWGLAGRAYPDYVRRELLDGGLLPALDRIRNIHRRTGLVLASYISLPRSADVVNALRVAICPNDPADCDRCCPRSSAPAARQCDAVNGVRDRDLFSSLLEPNQRSATFASQSTVVQHYGEHEVRFFYVRAGEEVARVEFPRWVEEEGRLDLAHSIVLDQCLRGQGYPVALSESHEQAVVTGADRDLFRHLVELALAGQRLPTTTSEKSMSKHTKWV
jgi:hypothetical protein